MGKIEPTMEQKSEKLNQILAQLKKQGKLKGIIFSYREGGVIAENLSEDYPEFDSEEYSSMCASALESAFGLAKTISSTGQNGFNKIIAELNEHTVIILECDKNTFLSFVLNEKSKINPLLENIENYIRKIIFLY